MITLNKLVPGYPGHCLTGPFSGTFTEGSLTAVTGANGSGKSTLLKTICGLLAPVSGSVSLSAKARGQIAWLPQQADIDHSFPVSVSDIVTMGCWPRRSLFRALRRDDRRRIVAAMERTGIEQLASLPLQHLSGGQFQRTLFARMLVQDAPVVLLDEPFTGIDPETREDLMQLILELHRSGKTLIAVLHDPGLVQRWFPEQLHIHEQQVRWGETLQARRLHSAAVEKTAYLFREEACNDVSCG